jgi:hypothetical protein
VPPAESSPSDHRLLLTVIAIVAVLASLAFAFAFPHWW